MKYKLSENHSCEFHADFIRYYYPENNEIIHTDYNYDGILSASETTFGSGFTLILDGNNEFKYKDITFFLADITQKENFFLELKSHTKMNEAISEVSFLSHYMGLNFYISLVFSLLFCVFILRESGVWVSETRLIATQLAYWLADSLGLTGSIVGLVLINVVLIYFSYTSWSKNKQKLVLKR